MRYLFLIGMIAFILGANYYVFYRLYQMLPPITIVRTVLIVVAVALVSSFFLFFFARDTLSPTLLTLVYKVGTSWFFIFIYLLMTMLVLDLVRVTHLLPVQNFMYKSWVGFFSVTGFVAIIMIWGYVRYENKRRVELDINLAKTTAAPAPLKIVAVSDLHLGYGIGRGEFEKWAELINKENPDVILIAGDVVDNNLIPLRDQRMDEVFRTLKSRYGIFASLGNHEYISGADASVEFLTRAGVTVLRDSAVLVDDRFYIVGRDDRSHPGRKEVAELVQPLDHSKPIIMLDHQPYSLENVEAANVDLQFSGHTHRGQIWPISWITDAIYENSHGYLRKGNSHIYVSSGLGIWGGKFRIGTQSEYVVINLGL